MLTPLMLYMEPGKLERRGKFSSFLADKRCYENIVIGDTERVVKCIIRNKINYFVIYTWKVLKCGVGENGEDQLDRSCDK